MEHGFGILTSMWVTPMIGVLILIFLPSRYETGVRLVSLLAAAITLVSSIYLYIQFDPRGGFQFEENMLWIDYFGVRYHHGADGLSVPLLLLTSIVIFCGILSSWDGIKHRVKEFHILMLLLVSGVFGVFISLDAVFFFIFYEIAVLPMYLLIIVWGSTRKEYSGMKLTLYLLFGSVFVLIGLIAVYVHTGMKTTDLLEFKALLAANPPSDLFVRTIFPMMFLGFGMLAAIWPFHTWSPDGHVAAPTAASMLHAGVLMKLGAFGILRVAVYLLPEGLRYWADMIVALSLVNIIYGAFVAMHQTDLKFVIGYSSVSHMGIVMFGIGMLNYEGFAGAAFQMFAHGVMTALFFACVGAIYDRAHTRQIHAFGGIYRRMPIVCGAFLCGGLAGLGLPGFAGFVAEFLVFWGAFKAHPVIASIAVVGLVLTAFYVLRVFQRAFFGEPNPKWDGLTDSSAIQNTAYAILIGTMLVFGIWPRLFLDIAQADLNLLLSEVLR
ncbi:MAG: NADH dehydrogenase [Candidatus Lindowbacteria bacterium RIFCSPLOWO2_12_FULL_62_27]|nr:MAG: NADH dehydrogenase [Candidatus Lindowbacteria bacterium RIFCSPLOWO2_12_FULL_62_27]OGH64021.1 MAG: NADH dehydrogenase [Candidatus Lindowbacteria bacterium RIFCSPLOWO2_02_FULL_62_12]